MNIIFITDDQHRWDFYDNRAVPGLRTPALDRLRADGMALPHTYSNCPICMPTRFSWLYGLYATQAAENLSRNDHDWPTTYQSMAHALQAAGYTTALIGKLHSHGGMAPFDLRDYAGETRSRGFDHVQETSGKVIAYWRDCHYTAYLKERELFEAYKRDIEQRAPFLKQVKTEPRRPGFLRTENTIDAFTARLACQWLEEHHRRAAPFFLHVSFCNPHDPLDPPEEYFYRHKPEDMPEPEGAVDPARIAEFKWKRAAYCGLIELVDAQIGAVLDKISELGLDDDTLMLFGTDHGETIGHHNYGTKGPFYDTSVRTPLIARLPGVIPAGVQRDAMIEAVDIPCTFIEAATGFDPRACLPSTPGRSFWKLLRGEADEHRPWVFSENRGALIRYPWLMCRERDWKYAYTEGAGDFLFDIRSDPWETDNLVAAPQHRETLARLRRQLIESLNRRVAPDTAQHVWEAKGLTRTVSRSSTSAS